MTEPEDGAGLPSLLASLNVCGLPASVLAVVEREADARSTWPPLDTGHDRADNAPMRGKSRREQVASMSKAEREAATRT